jgi:hypothetical protein
MTAASNYLEEKTLKHILQNVSTNGASYTAPTNIYVSLHTGNPGEANDGANEISGSGYARELVTFGDVTTVADVCSVSSNVTVTFNQATSNYSADVTYIGIYDALTVGNLLFYGALSTAKTVTSGDVFQINSGSLTITLD